MRLWDVERGKKLASYKLASKKDFPGIAVASSWVIITGKPFTLRELS